MKRHILLCVVGTTPQIITETIYALSQKEPPVKIEELFVITTTTGAEKIRSALIEQGYLERLINDYGLSKIKFLPDRNIYIIKSDDGTELSDIRSRADNESAGELITEVVKRLTSEPETILHCSLAGGRKTMGYYLGSALQLYGRRDDRLYHVLVSEAFEGHSQFFYPPPVPVELEVRKPDGGLQKVSTKEAKVELAELPFIRLRDYVDFESKNFKELIDITQRELDEARRVPSLRFILREKRVLIGKEEIKLSPALWRVYYKIASLKKDCKSPHRKTCRDCYDCFMEMKGDNGLLNLFNDLKDYQLRSSISKINATIKKQIKDKSLSRHYIITTSIRKYGGTRYGILLNSAKIIIQEES